MTATSQHQRTRATLHQIARWVDHPGGTCITECGRTITCGTSAKYIDTNKTPAIDWESCPLCEVATIINHIHNNERK